MLIRNRGLMMWLLALHMIAAGWGGILSMSSGQTLGEESQQSYQQDSNNQDRKESGSAGSRLRYEAIRTVQDLKVLFEKERDERRADIEDLRSSLLHKINDCFAAVDKERAARLDADTKIVRQVDKDIERLQDRVETETATREAEFNQVHSEVEDIRGNNRNGSDEEFQAVVLEEIASLKTALAVEHDERVAKDEEIVEAVFDYVHTLQDGLHNLAKS